MKNTSLKNWIPIKLNFENSEILCDWLYVGDKTFTEPFFESTILDCRNFPENRKYVKSTSTLKALPEFSNEAPFLEPKAIIFHISRSGSTLISQLLASNPQNLVVAEAPFFDQILRQLSFRKEKFSKDEIEKIFKAAVQLYGKIRDENVQNYFIKLDSWHIMYYGILRKVFPDTPFVFSFRKPAEVISSHKKQAGMQVVPGFLEPQLFGIELNNKFFADNHSYMIKLFETYFEKLIEISEIDKNSLFVDFNKDFGKVFLNILSFIKVKLSAENEKIITEKLNFHSKKPFENFHEINDFGNEQGYENLNKLYNKLKSFSDEKNLI